MNNKGPLKFLAFLIGTMMLVLPFAGMDGLPRDTRKSIESERSALASATTQIKSAQSEVTQSVQADPELFRGIPASARWPGDLGQASSDLQSASQDLAQIAALEKANKRGDRDRVESLISRERGLRTSAVARATGVQKDAAHWVDLKKRLPDVLRQMDADYQTVHGYDFSNAAAAVQKAEVDWPQKKGDLDTRLEALRGLPAQSDSLWQSTAAARKEAAAGNYASADLGGLLTAADTLHATATDLPKKSDDVKALTGQLYTSWDKLLVDMESGSHAWKQKIRTVTTKVESPAAQNGATTQDEKWVEVPRNTYEAEKSDLGMAVEHKALGKYDSEADRVAQPAGFAYMAPPGQRNQYGYWDHSGGRDFWVFYGQYALMRDLLFNHDYRPLYRGDWDEYRTYQSRGQTYYGRDEATSAPKYGTAGSTTQDRYSGSTFAKSGGFKDSKYASKSGNYRDSQYSSPNARNPGEDHSPRKFGSGSSREEPHVAPPPSRSYRPAPRPSMPRSAPRRFGKR